jgi:hypothetical protein
MDFLERRKVRFDAAPLFATTYKDYIIVARGLPYSMVSVSSLKT